MAMSEVVDYLEGYARSFEAPVEESTTVTSVEPSGGGYRVATERGGWQARNVVIATGYCDVPFVPSLAAELPPDVAQVVPTRYRNPGELPEGGVLVVGASASGVQLADEIHASGRPVTLAVGRHTRLPRLYRGRDILWWLDAMGVFDEAGGDGLRPRDLETAAVAAARGPSRSRHARPAAAGAAGRPAGGPRRGGGRGGDVVRRRPRGPHGGGGREARAPHRAHRRVRRLGRARVGGRAGGAVPAVPVAGSGAREDRPASGGHPNGGVGHGLSPAAIRGCECRSSTRGASCATKAA